MYICIINICIYIHIYIIWYKYIYIFDINKYIYISTYIYILFIYIYILYIYIPKNSNVECNLWKLQVGVHAAHSQSEALKPGGQSLPSHNESGTSLPGWLIGDAKACHVLVVLKVGAPLKHHKGFKYVKYVKTAIPWISWDDFTSMLGSAWPHGSSIFRKNLLWPWPQNILWGFLNLG